MKDLFKVSPLTQKNAGVEEVIPTHLALSSSSKKQRLVAVLQRLSQKQTVGTSQVMILLTIWYNLAVQWATLSNMYLAVQIPVRNGSWIGK